MSGVIFDCRDWGGIADIQQIEVKNVAKHPTIHKIPPPFTYIHTPKNYQVRISIVLRLRNSLFKGRVKGFHQLTQGREKEPQVWVGSTAHCLCKRVRFGDKYDSEHSCQDKYIRLPFSSCNHITTPYTSLLIL